MIRILTFVLLLLLTHSAHATNLVLIQFDCADFQFSQSLLEELESKGATARHVFAPNSAIVDAHGLSPDLLADDTNRWTVVTEADLTGSRAALVDDRILDAYRHLINPPPAETNAGGGGGIPQLSESRG